MDLHEIKSILQLAADFKRDQRRDLSRVPFLQNQSVALLFFEPSTRTSLSFAVAARKLGLEVFEFRQEASSQKKGEDDFDTVRNVDAIVKPAAMVVRHADSQMAQKVTGLTNAAVINAGCGVGEHPTQALLDAFTLMEHLGRPFDQDLSGVTVAIVGDIAHSRVAHSNMEVLAALGASIQLFGPAEWLPAKAPNEAVTICASMDEVLSGADAVMMLRIQRERMADPKIGADYLTHFGLTLERFAKLPKQVVVMHPGPMNRGVEIESSVADHERSLILKQAENGVFIRMAVLYESISSRTK